MSNTLSTLFDRNAAALTAREPYFAPTFESARSLLDAAHAGNGGLHWSTGAVCGPHGCSCGDKACLHQVSWRIYSHAGT